MGFFIPTTRPAKADLQALRDAADKLESIMSLTEDDVEAAVRDFDVCAKAQQQHADAHRRDAAHHRPWRECADAMTAHPGQRLLLNCPIWTEDRDFFGTGVATWPTALLKLLGYFAPAVGLGLAATLQQSINVDIHGCFGEPVYGYSLRDGVNDGCLGCGSNAIESGCPAGRPWSAAQKPMWF